MANENQILIVVRESARYQDLSDILRDSGYRVKCIGERNITKENILEEITHQSNALIFLGEKLKDFDSYELCKIVKENQGNIEIPVIFLGEEDHLKTKIKAFDFGAQDYIAYPYYQEEILVKVNTYLKLRNLEYQLQIIRKKLSDNIFSDSLTNLANQRYFLQYLETEWNRCARERVSLGDGDYTMLSVIFIGINNYQYYQEKYGISQTEELLIEITDSLKNRLKRPKDLLARYADNIFAVILPNTDGSGVERVTNVLYEEIKPFEQNNLITFSLSAISRIPSRALEAEILIEMGLESLAKAQETPDNPIILDSEEMDF
jgi:diguanylate cyclase (GGDEF)-like protein